MRLFVALWPAPHVLDALDGLVRADDPGVRWTGRDQWHVTLRFLGDVEDGAVPALVEALAAAGRRPPRLATLGPATARLGRHALVVPVAGVDDLGAAAVDATRGFGGPSEDRPFTGHLTVARSRGSSAVPARLAGQPLDAAWTVGELALVRSRLSSGGARYETIATVALDPSLAGP